MAHDDVTPPAFDPYAVVYLKNAAWYTVGYCHLRADVRVFRLDCVASVEPEGTPFARPTDFDSLAYVQRSFALLPARWSAEIALDASPEEARRWVTSLFAVVTEEAGETIVRCSAMDIDWLARALVGLTFAFRVRTPPALIEALTTVRDRINQAIARSGPPDESPQEGDGRTRGADVPSVHENRHAIATSSRDLLFGHPPRGMYTRHVRADRDRPPDRAEDAAPDRRQPAEC